MRSSVHVVLALAACGGSGQPVAESAPPNEPPPVAGARVELVRESVLGGQVYVLDTGGERESTMVLVHGLGQNASRDWDTVVPALAARHRVIAVDLPGFGRSTGGNHPYSPELYVSVLDEVLRARVSEPFVLVGHSMGGAVSLLYAATHPDRVDRLVLIDAAGILHRDTYTSFMMHARLNSLLASVATTVMSPFARRTPNPELLLESEVTRETFLGGDPNRIAALALILHDFGPALDRVRAPTLILWGADDDIAAMRVARLLESRLPAARLEVRQGVGHLPMVDDPAWVIERVDAFAVVEAPVPAPPPAPGASVGRCTDVREPHVIEGAYDRIEIERCRDVELRGVVARSIVVRDSVVSLDRVRITGPVGAPGLDLTESVVRMTGGRVEAPVCVRLAGSELDVAGAVLECEESAFVALDRSKLVLSVTRASTTRGTRHYHEVRVIDDGERL